MSVNKRCMFGPSKERFAVQVHIVRQKIMAAVKPFAISSLKSENFWGPSTDKGFLLPASVYVACKTKPKRKKERGKRKKRQKREDEIKRMQEPVDAEINKVPRIRSALMAGRGEVFPSISITS